MSNLAAASVGEPEPPSFQRNTKRKASSKNEDCDEDESSRERRRQLNQQRRDKLKDSLSVMRKILGLNNRADHLTVMRMANQRLSQQHVKPDPALTHSSSNSSPETGVKHPWTANSRASLVEEPAEEKKKSLWPPAGLPPAVPRATFPNCNNGN